MSRAAVRFIKYSAVGFGTFSFDLLLLYLLTDFWQINYLVAAAISFAVAVSINYYLSRKYIFKWTLRGAKSGYLYFLLIAGLGMVIVTIGMYLLVVFFGLNYLVARISVAIVTGLWNYLLNLYVNFKVAGLH